MSFSAQVQMWCRDAAEGLDKARADALLEIGTAIIAETPKDTGLARGNWQSSIGEAKEEILPLRPSVAAVAELAATVGSLKGDETFILRNNLPYATPLEFGHSQQAPAGMVRKNVQKWNAAVERAAAKGRTK